MRRFNFRICSKSSFIWVGRGCGGVVFCYCSYVVCLFLVLPEFAFRSHIIKHHFSKVRCAACAVGGLEYICILVYVPKAYFCALVLSVPGCCLWAGGGEKTLPTFMMNFPQLPLTSSYC